MLTVVGAGAIGLSLAARLARAGHAVRLCTRRAEDAALLAEHGVTVEDPASGESFRAAVEAQAGPPPGERDFALVCVRGPDTEAAARALAAASPQAAVVSVQNGIETDAILARHLPRVIGAVIRHPCTRVSPTRVRALGAGRMIVGAHPEGAGDDVLRLAALLRDAAYDVGVSTRIAEDRWLKLCVNLMSTPNALVRPAEHATRAFTEGKARLLEEARDALAAAGIAVRSCDGRDRSLDAEIAFQRGALTRGDAARKLPIYNSLWQGLARGAALEVDAYHRAILELGARHGVATPVNARVLECVLRAARERLGPECFGAEELLGRPH